MAKSSLQFLERRNIDVYSTDSHAVRTLVKEDCGKVIVLNRTKGHTLTLPSAADAGEGWNARIIIGTAHSDLTERLTTTITAPSGDSNIVLLAATTDASQGTAGVAEITDALDLSSEGDGDSFTITVGTAAGGSGATFTFTLQDAAHASAGAANTFIIKRGVAGETDSDARITARIVDCLKGTATTAGTVDRPATGEGSEGTAILGISNGVFDVSAESGDQVRFTFTALGTAAPAAVALGTTAGTDPRVGNSANVGAVTPETAGVVAPAVTASGRVATIDPSGVSAGDQIDLHVYNGVWFVKSTCAS